MPRERMKLKVVACGVFEDELNTIAASCPHELDIELLDAGLHSAPDLLRLRAQAAVDLASRSGGYDAICFAYGLCGRGTAGLIARDVPLVIPRVHDCIALFLGSAQEYRRQFMEHPGTFWFTTGWHSKHAHPEHRRMAIARRFDPTKHPHYRDFEAKYGDDNARFLVEFFESWRRNYSRAALIDHGFATDEHESATQAMAEAAGWEYERILGSLELLEDLCGGRWDDDRFVVVEPGNVVVSAPGDTLFDQAPASGQNIDVATVGAGHQGPAGRVPMGTYLVGDKTTIVGEGADVGLGIDAGGTYTDAVTFEFATGRVLSKAKAVTTHHDLTRGIAEAVGGLNPEHFRRVSYVCLSTTLATNAIVEGRGRPVGLLLMPHSAGAAAAIRAPLCRVLSARMDITGEVEAPVDPEEVAVAARELLEAGAASFAVSGYGAVRNPAHEQQVRDILRERFGMPVVCGHELSGRLNFVARAHTAVLNARLIPMIEHLLEAVDTVLSERGVHAPIYVVRGDGSIMRREVARTRAIETVMSGPAASAAGGRYLTGSEDALVVDMGGTTTDIAAMRDGRLALTPEGARVGDWQTSVSAADIQTSGLGGDSLVRPGKREGLQVGPGRVVPLSWLATVHGEVADVLSERSALLDAQDADGCDVAAGDFFILAGRVDGLALVPDEQRIVDLLEERPYSRLELARRCGCMAPQLLRTKRLESAGVIRRSAPTPTDALHVLGTFTGYDVEVARLAMEWVGRFIGRDAKPTARLVVEEVERLLSLAIMRRELTVDGDRMSPEHFDHHHALFDRIVGPHRDEGFRLLWQQVRPVVGIGAPIAAFLPGACRRLGADPIVPDHADVANAVGAVTSGVVVTDRIRVRPGQFGGYVMFAPDERREFGRLEAAETCAREHMVELVRCKARGFGTSEEQVRVEVVHHIGRLQDGGTQLLEVEVQGFLAGAPTLA